MIKGWRLQPEWVRLRREQDAARCDREIKMMNLKIERSMKMAALGLLHLEMGVSPSRSTQDGLDVGG